MTFVTLLKNLFVKTVDTPYIETSATVALILLVSSLFIQKHSLANLLTDLVNFLKTPANKTHMIVFYTIFTVNYIGATFVIIILLLENHNLARSDEPTGFPATLVCSFLLDMIKIPLKLLILETRRISCSLGLNYLAR